MGRKRKKKKRELPVKSRAEVEAVEASDADDSVSDQGLEETGEEQEEEHPVVTLPAPPAETWKIVAREAQLQNARERVRIPVFQRIQELYQREFAKALVEDSEYQKAIKERDGAIKELTDLIKGDIPEGYVVSEVNSDEMTVTCRFDASKKT